MLSTSINSVTQQLITVFISKNIEQRLTNSEDNNILEMRYIKTTSLTLTGNAILDFFIFLLRNPLLDFSYINTIGLHYDTLDKFWDKRPSTTKWLWTDITGFSPLGGYTVKESNKLVQSNWENNNKTDALPHKYFKKIQLGAIPEEFFINKFTAYVGKNINRILNISQQKMNKIITMEFITENKKIQKQKNCVKNKETVKKALHLNFKNLEYLEKIKLNDKYIQQINVRTINLLKNLASGKGWAQFTRDNVSYVQLNKNFKNKSIITREELKKNILNQLICGQIKPEVGAKQLKIFDIFFNKNKEITIRHELLWNLLILGLIEWEEYQNKLFPLTIETLTILHLLEEYKLNMKTLQFLLTSEEFWKKLNIKINEKISNLNINTIKEISRAELKIQKAHPSCLSKLQRFTENRNQIVIFKNCKIEKLAKYTINKQVNNSNHFRENLKNKI